MAKQSRYMKAAAQGQMPLLTPDSSWVVPALPDWRGRPFIAVDSETMDLWLASGQGAGWSVGAGKVIGVSAAVSETEAFYAPIAHPDTDCIPKENVVSWLRDHFACGAKIIMQKATYDVGWFKADFGLDIDSSHLHDTMIEQYMLDENRLQYGLDSICKSLGIPGKDESLLREAAACFGVDPKGGMHLMPARYVGPYAEVDAIRTLQAHQKLWPKLVEEELEEPYQLEIDLVPMIVEMRRRGIRVDLDYADGLRTEMCRKRDEVLKELSIKSGIGRAVSIKDVRSNAFKQNLFDRENLPYPRTERGAPSFEAKKLAGLQHWLPKMLIQATKYEDAANKFIGNYVMNYSHLGRIHAEIHTTKDQEEAGGEGGGTATSRLAYSDPPLQQAPSRDEEIGPAFRSIFKPEVGEMWLAADFSQQEFRLLVHFSSLCKIVGVEKAVEIYNNDPDVDFHDVVVELTGLPRRSAKDTNFAKVYRAGKQKFADMIGKSLEEATAIYDKYDEMMPFVSRFGEFCDSRAQQRGYLKLLDGARAHFDRWEAKWVPKEKFIEALKNNVPVSPCSLSEAQARVRGESYPWLTNHPWYQAKLKRAGTYKAANRETQGSASRQTKLAMRGLWREGMVPLVQMHDDLNFSGTDPALGRRVVEIMRDAAKLVVPVKVDEEWGIDWGSARKVEEKRGDKKVVIYKGSHGEASEWLRTGVMPRQSPVTP